MQVRARSSWSVPGQGTLLVLVLLCAVPGGCVTSSRRAPPAQQPSADLSDQIRGVDLQARSPQGGGPVGANRAEGIQAVTYYGDGSSAIARGNDDSLTTGSLTEGPKPAGEAYEINFENAPLATVAKAVLGDILGVGYTIDPRVQATVSLSSGRPVARKDILFVLESALRVSNVALVREAQGYRLVPSQEAIGTGTLDGSAGLEPGYGLTVVPLQFVSAQTLIKLLDNFATKPGMVRADPARNLVIVQGNAADRRAALGTVLSFDADWMRGQSVGIYPVSNGTPEPMIDELEKIIDAGEGGLSQNLVKLQPIGRQNAILVVTRKPELLKTVSTWITRLDKAGSAGTGVRVYRMRYGDARQVAALLNDMFTGESGGALESPTNQLAPRSGALASTSNRSGFGGSPTPQQQLASAASPGGGLGGATQPNSGAMNFDARFADASGGRFNQLAPPAPPVRVAGGGAAGAPFTNVRISPDVVNNALLVYSNQENYRIIERAVRQIDQPQLQVAIDATIAEVTLNDKLNYGVQFFLKSSDVGLGSDAGSILNTASATSTVLSRMIPGFNFLVGTQAEPRVILDALHKVTDVKVLSTPSLVVLDNQFAALLVGDQIPVTTRTAQSVEVPTAPIVNNIDYRNTGVILRVMPRINANGNVLLDVEQEISSVAQTATADTLTPTVSQRKVRSSIAVASGQTVLLGGLISERHDKTRSGVPGLDQVPGLGALFSHTIGTMERTELIIFIRPQIIRNGVDAQHVAEALRAQMRGFAPPPAPLPKRPTVPKAVLAPAK